MRVDLSVTHGLGKQIPFDLREGVKEVFTGEHGELTLARLFDRAVKHLLCGFGEFACRDVEIVDVPWPSARNGIQQKARRRRQRKCRAPAGSCCQRDGSWRTDRGAQTFV